MPNTMINPDRIPETDLSQTGLLESAMITDIPFYAKMKAMSNPNSRVSFTPTSSFDIYSDQATDIMKEYGVENMQDRASRFDATNETTFRNQLATYSIYKEADKQLSEAGFVPASLAHLGAGGIMATIAAPIGGGLLAGLSSKAVTALATAETAGINATISAITGGLEAAAIGGATEALTETVAYNYDSNRIKDVMIGSAVFGASVGGITGMLKNTRNVKSTENIIRGIDSLGNPEVAELEFVSPTGKLLSGVSDQLYRNDSVFQQEALKISNSTMALKNKETGEVLIQKGGTAEDIKEQNLGIRSVAQKENRDLYEAKYSHMSVDDFVEKQGQEATIYQNKVEKAASQMYLDEIKSEQDAISLYKKETGQELLPNEAKVVKLEQDVANTIKVKEQAVVEHKNKVLELQKNKDSVIASKKQEFIDAEMKPLYEAQNLQASKLNTQVASLDEELTKLTTARKSLQEKYDTINSLSEDSFKTQKEFNINISKVEKLLSELATIDKKITKVSDNKTNILTNIDKIKSTTPTMSDKQVALIESKVSKEIKNYERQITELQSKKVTKDIDKQLSELNKNLEAARKDIAVPEDLDKVVMNHFYKRVDGMFPVPEIVAPLRKFYSSYLKNATEAKVHGLAGKSDVAYHNRMWSEKAFRENTVDYLEGRLVDGMKSHVITRDALEKGLIKESDLVETARAMVRDINSNDLAKEFTEVGFSNKASAGNPFKERVIKIDTDRVMDLLVHDTEAIMDRYSQKVSGRIALKSLGIDVGQGARNLSEAMEKKRNSIKEAALAKGVSEKDIVSGMDNLKVAYEAILGTRNIVNKPDALGHKVASYGRLLASSAYAGGFVKSAIGELGAVLQRSSLEALRSFVPAHDLVLNGIKEGNKQLAKELLELHIGNQILDGAKTSRYEMDIMKKSHSYVERQLISLNRKQRQLTGFNHVTAITDNMAALAFFKELKSISDAGGKLTRGEVYRFSRLGLSADDIRVFNEKAGVAYDKKGNLSSINWDSWEDQGYAQMIKYATSRHVRDTVLRGDALHLPKVATDVNSDLLSLFFQFKHYPIEATNRLLLAGMTENMAGTLAGAIASMGIAASMTKLTDEALYQLGVKDKRLEDSELFKKAFDKSSQSGVIPNILSLGADLTGTSDFRQKEITKDFFGASGTIANTAWSLWDKMTHNEPMMAKDWDKLYQIVPLSHIPIINEVSRSLIRNNF